MTYGPAVSRIRTAQVLKAIDHCLSTLQVPTRSTWTTQEIEDLLLDLRQEIVFFDQLQADFDTMEDRVNRVRKWLK